MIFEQIPRCFRDQTAVEQDLDVKIDAFVGDAGKGCDVGSRTRAVNGKTFENEDAQFVTQSGQHIMEWHRGTVFPPVLPHKGLLQKPIPKNWDQLSRAVDPRVRICLIEKISFLSMPRDKSAIRQLPKIGACRRLMKVNEICNGVYVESARLSRKANGSEYIHALHVGQIATSPPEFWRESHGCSRGIVRFKLHEDSFCIQQP